MRPAPRWDLDPDPDPDPDAPTGSLIRRRARVFRVELDDPKIEVQVVDGGGGKKKKWGAKLRERLSSQSPRVYQRIQVRRGEVTFSDETSDAKWFPAEL